MRYLIRQGEGPAASILRLHHEHAQHRARLERNIAIAQTAPDLDSSRVSSATAGGDEAKLRGIPAIARGVSGEIPGTRPGDIR